VLHKAIPAGEREDILESLPNEFRELFGELSTEPAETETVDQEYETTYVVSLGAAVANFFPERADQKFEKPDLPCWSSEKGRAKKLPKSLTLKMKERREVKIP
jgi:hypothetical protein